MFHVYLPVLLATLARTVFKLASFKHRGFQGPGCDSTLTGTGTATTSGRARTARTCSLWAGAPPTTSVSLHPKVGYKRNKDKLSLKEKQLGQKARELGQPGRLVGRGQ